MAPRCDDNMPSFLTTHYKSLLLLSCLAWACTAYASEWQKEVSETEALITRAKSVGSLWRDTEKLLANAKELIAAGKQEQAEILLHEAGQQAELAYQQATTQPTKDIVPYYLK